MWGKNNLVITRRYGPRVRFGAVFVDADWPADRPILDYYCPSCTLCWIGLPDRMRWAPAGTGAMSASRSTTRRRPWPRGRRRWKRAPLSVHGCNAQPASPPALLAAKLPATFYRDVKRETSQVSVICSVQMNEPCYLHRMTVRGEHTDE